MSIKNSYLVNLSGFHGLVVDSHKLDSEFAIGNCDMRETEFSIVQELESAHARPCEASWSELGSGGSCRDLMNGISLDKFLIASALTEEDLLVHDTFVRLKQMLCCRGFMTVD